MLIKCTIKRMFLKYIFVYIYVSVLYCYSKAHEDVAFPEEICDLCLEDKEPSDTFVYQGDGDEDDVLIIHIFSIIEPRTALRDPSILWKNGIVPYKLSNKFDAHQKSVIKAAADEFKKNSCVRFIPRTTEKQYLVIEPGKGCSSVVGKVPVPGSDTMMLGKGCFVKGTIMHEMMHVLGFVHEQNRPDRDDFVAIMDKNIQDDKKSQFVKYSWDKVKTFNLPYDYDSIMHYGRFVFAKDKNKPTILPFKEGVRIGQRHGFSKLDVIKINLLYNCTKNGSDETTVTVNKDSTLTTKFLDVTSIFPEKSSTPTNPINDDTTISEEKSFSANNITKSENSDSTVKIEDSTTITSNRDDTHITKTTQITVEELNTKHSKDEYDDDWEFDIPSLVESVLVRVTTVSSPKITTLFETFTSFGTVVSNGETTSSIITSPDTTTSLDLTTSNDSSVSQDSTTLFNITVSHETTTGELSTKLNDSDDTKTTVTELRTTFLETTTKGNTELDTKTLQTDNHNASEDDDFGNTFRYHRITIMEIVTGRTALRDPSKVWVNGVIPYVFSDKYDDLQKSLIIEGMEEFRNKTCIQFVERTDDFYYIYIEPKDRCAASLGFQVNKPNGVILGDNCYLKGIIIHELMHVLGFVHEQNRPDRDQYVVIMYDNIIPRFRWNFNKYNWSEVRSFGVSYDYQSIMHYGAYEFAIDENRPTIIPLKHGVKIGQTDGFSRKDLFKINKLYNCTSTYGNTFDDFEDASILRDFKKYFISTMAKLFRSIRRTIILFKPNL